MSPDPYSWSVDAEVVVLVPALAAAYLLGHRLSPAPRARVAAFVAAEALILVVFATPVQTIALHYLLTAHLLQNVVLAEWAPALLVLSVSPAWAAHLACAPVFRALTHPLVALPLWIAVYDLWHLPWAYDAALRRPDTLLHLEHLSYLAAGFLLWWPVFQRVPRALPAGVRAGYLFAGFVLASPLGLLLALVPRAVYDVYAHAPRLWGIDALGDQQIAGITMALEQAAVFFALFAAAFVRFVREEQARDLPLVR